MRPTRRSGISPRGSKKGSTSGGSREAAGSSEKRPDVQFNFKPHPRLFISLMIVLVLWAGFLLGLYLFTVRSR
jgi:hypothetical protein